MTGFGFAKPLGGKGTNQFGVKGTAAQAAPNAAVRPSADARILPDFTPAMPEQSRSARRRCGEVWGTSCRAWVYGPTWKHECGGTSPLELETGSAAGQIMIAIDQADSSEEVEKIWAGMPLNQKYNGHIIECLLKSKHTPNNVLDEAVTIYGRRHGSGIGSPLVAGWSSLVESNMAAAIFHKNVPTEVLMLHAARTDTFPRPDLGWCSIRSIREPQVPEVLLAVPNWVQELPITTDPVSAILLRTNDAEWLAAASQTIIVEVARTVADDLSLDWAKISPSFEVPQATAKRQATESSQLCAWICAMLMNKNLPSSCVEPLIDTLIDQQGVDGKWKVLLAHADIEDSSKAAVYTRTCSTAELVELLRSNPTLATPTTHSESTTTVAA